MSNRSFSLPSDYVRRLPDPVTKNAERYIAYVKAADVPPGIPLDPNPRGQNIDRLVYRDVRTSLLNQNDPSFHLKNKGITMIAERVRATSGQPLEIRLGAQHGILDGGHTYKIILEGQEEEVPDNQFVKFEILVGVDEELVTDIAGGLNTGIQVQQMSLANLDGQFAWIKERLSDPIYEAAIAYRENDDRPFDVRDVIAYMALFNIDLYPNDKSEYPITAYRAKSTTLKQFIDKPDSYAKLKGILPEILELADTIRCEAPPLHNSAGGRAGGLAFVDQKQKGTYSFPFIERQSQSRLTSGALFPMLGGFRWMVEEADDGSIQWKGSFKEVKALWKKLGPELMKTTQETSGELGRKPNAIGKSRSHWATMHGIVLKEQLISAARAADN